MDFQDTLLHRFQKLFFANLLYFYVALHSNIPIQIRWLYDIGLWFLPLQVVLLLLVFSCAIAVAAQRKTEKRKI